MSYYKLGCSEPGTISGASTPKEESNFKTIALVGALFVGAVVVVKASRPKGPTGDDVFYNIMSDVPKFAEQRARHRRLLR